MASIQKNNKFQKLRLCPWSFAQGQKEKVNKKMEEKGEKEKKEKEKEKGKEPEWDGSLSQEEATALETFINRENDKMKQVDERIKMEQEDKMKKEKEKEKEKEQGNEKEKEKERGNEMGKKKNTYEKTKRKKKKKKKIKKKKKMEEKENGKEPEKWKGSWSQREVTTIDEFEMVPDSEDDCQMFCWVQKKEKMAKTKDKTKKDEHFEWMSYKAKELERLQAPLKWRPCTDLFLGLTQSLPLQVSEEEIEFSKNLNRHVKTKHKIHIDRERGRDRLHRDRMAKAEWPELSQRRIEFNNGWQKHISEDPEEYVEIGCDF